MIDETERKIGTATGPEARDQEVRRRLRAGLERQQWLAAQDVHVTVERGIVHLDGIVAEPSIADALREVAADVAGEDYVQDDLVVVDALAASAIVLG